jgi:hypothetical protein
MPPLISLQRLWEEKEEWERVHQEVKWTERKLTNALAISGKTEEPKWTKIGEFMSSITAKLENSSAARETFCEWLLCADLTEKDWKIRK